MSKSVGFAIPNRSLTKSYQLIIIIALVTVLLDWLINTSNGRSALTTLAVTAFLFALAYWYTSRYKWVYLSPDGIQGQSPLGSRVFIPWTATVSLEKRSAFGGISCISINEPNKKSALMIPVSIMAAPEFQESLRLQAPSNHPLLGLNH